MCVKCAFVLLTVLPSVRICVTCNVIANKEMSHLTRLINLQKLNGFKPSINLFYLQAIYWMAVFSTLIVILVYLAHINVWVSWTRTIFLQASILIVSNMHTVYTYILNHWQKSSNRTTFGLFVHLYDYIDDYIY